MSQLFATPGFNPCPHRGPREVNRGRRLRVPDNLARLPCPARAPRATVDNGKAGVDALPLGIVRGVGRGVGVEDVLLRGIDAAVVRRERAPRVVAGRPVAPPPAQRKPVRVACVRPVVRLLVLVQAVVDAVGVRNDVARLEDVEAIDAAPRRQVRLEQRPERGRRGLAPCVGRGAERKLVVQVRRVQRARGQEIPERRCNLGIARDAISDFAHRHHGPARAGEVLHIARDLFGHLPLCLALVDTADAHLLRQAGPGDGDARAGEVHRGAAPEVRTLVLEREPGSRAGDGHVRIAALRPHVPG